MLLFTCWHMYYLCSIHCQLFSSLLFSFTDSKAIATGKLTWDSFTFENYLTVFTDASAYQPFLVSIIYSALTAIIVVGFILYIARLIQKYNNKWTAMLRIYSSYSLDATFRFNCDGSDYYV